MIDVAELMKWSFTPKSHSYDEADCRLYALSIGLGDDPLDRRQLRFVYENDLRVFPTIAATWCTPGPWFGDPATGLDAGRTIHSGQRLQFHAQAPVESTVTSRTRIAGIVDQGPGRGCLVHVERDLRSESSRLATVEDVYFGIRQGGFGGSPDLYRPGRPLPDRAPDADLLLATRPSAALLYRLNGDRSAFHADPDVARAAGFERPVLHGPCLLAMAARAVLEIHCDLDHSALREIDARFSSPHLPGETLRVETWTGTGGYHFRAISVERGKTVLDGGFAAIPASPEIGR